MNYMLRTKIFFLPTHAQIVSFLISPFIKSNINLKKKERKENK